MTVEPVEGTLEGAGESRLPNTVEGIENEISDLLDFEPTPTTESAEGGDPKVEEPSGKGEKVEVVPGESVEGAEKMPSAESATKVESSVIEPQVESPSEVEILRKQVESLTSLVDKLSNKPVEQSTPPPPVSSEPSADLIEELNKVDFDEIMESKEAFVKFMATALTNAKEVAKRELTQELPSYVSPVIQQHRSLEEVRNAFYQAHPELNPVKSYVTSVAAEIGKANPEWTVSQVLDETAKVVKEALHLTSVAPTASAPTTPPSKPTLPGGNNSTRVPTPAKTDFQKELEDFLDD